MPTLKTLGRIFVTGLLTLLPILVTVYFVAWALTFLERFFGRQVLMILPDAWYYTGMGLAVAILIIFAVGLLMHGYLFRKIFALLEQVFTGIPLVRSVYTALRDLIGLFAEKKDPALAVVMVSFPQGVRLLGFVTREDCRDAPQGIACDDEVAVYLPMSYQVGGFTVFVKRDWLTPVAMSREEAMKFALTAGLRSSAPAPSTPAEEAPASVRTRAS